MCLCPVPQVTAQQFHLSARRETVVSMEEMRLHMAPESRWAVRCVAADMAGSTAPERGEDAW